MIQQLVSAIQPFDDLEAAHRLDTLRWLESTDDVFRRSKPATPSRHLVSYIPVLDPADGHSLLVHHLNAGRWLPPGGHVEPDEHPVDTARREAREELDIPALFLDYPPEPAFLTVTVTGGVDRGHTDVSLWFPLRWSRDRPVTGDAEEFSEHRWWSASEIRSAEPGRLDPHYVRFADKLGI